jgi:protein SCO1/2
VGDQITADVVVSNGAAHLENVVVVKKGTGAPPAPTGASLKPGGDDQVPDFALVNQDGKRVQLDRYRGKAVLLTFIYTRCPLPDYCPLMTHNFAEIEKGLAKTPDVYAKTHLLSISFDPKYDTPEVLRKYASAFVADPKKPPFDHWEFASITEPERADIARFFNLFLNETNGQVTHSLSTDIIAPDGHVYRSYYDNDWKPADVLSELTALVGNPAQERTAISSVHGSS